MGLLDRLRNTTNIYLIQCALAGEKSEIAIQTKKHADALIMQMVTVPRLTQVKAKLPSHWKIMHLFYLKTGDWQTIQEDNPVLTVCLNKGTFQAGEYDLRNEVYRLPPESTLLFMTVIGTDEYAVLGIHCVKSKERYQAVYMGASHYPQTLIAQIDAFFERLGIPLKKCIVDYYYAKLDMNFACDILRALQQLKTAQLTAQDLWHYLLDTALKREHKSTASDIQGKFLTVVQKIKMMNMLSFVMVDGISQYYQKKDVVSNFFCRPLTLVTPAEEMNVLFERHVGLKQWFLLIYGDMHAGHLELARQIAQVRLYSLAGSNELSQNYIQWILECEHEPTLRLYLENLISRLEGKKVTLDTFIDSTALIQEGIICLVKFIKKHQPSANKPFHLSLIFKNIQTKDWIAQWIQHAKHWLSIEHVQCTFLFLMDIKSFDELKVQHPDSFTLLTLAPLDARACIQGKRQERLVEGAIDLEKLTIEQRKMLSQLALFVGKPLKNHEYVALIKCLKPEEMNAKKVWDDLKATLIKEHWVEYDDIFEGERCRYSLADALRNTLLKAYFYRNITQPYTLPTSLINLKIPRDDYHVLIGYLNELINLINAAEQLLESTVLTRAARLTLTYTLVNEFKHIVTIEVSLKTMDKLSLEIH